jgi:hypothetical protein
MAEYEKKAQDKQKSSVVENLKKTAEFFGLGSLIPKKKTVVMDTSKMRDAFADEKSK